MQKEIGREEMVSYLDLLADLERGETSQFFGEVARRLRCKLGPMTSLISVQHEAVSG